MHSPLFRSMNRLYESTNDMSKVEFAAPAMEETDSFTFSLQKITITEKRLSQRIKAPDWKIFKFKSSIWSLLDFIKGKSKNN